ncbi:MAG TPA: methionyl-tRNA formyltransferase [Candidatus Nitrosocosmicus sp.]|nr:methionyl-tRNA formyltransferase [Candidatus Nitrosocosmicus sp.]
MKKISIAYFGTPDFSAGFLAKILKDKDLPLEVKLVVTQPDRAVGRKQIITPSPVKEVAQKYNIDLFAEDKLDNLPEIMKEYEIDLCILFAYGRIIKKELLETPRYGFWNVHLSMLPKYRGASPVIYSLIMGDTKTAATLMKLVEKMDQGPIVAQKEVEITPNEKNPELLRKLTDSASEVLRNLFIMGNTKQTDPHEILKQVQDDISAQDHTQATYTRLIKKDDGYIPLDVIKKALRNEPLSHDELPTLIKEYIEKNYSVIPSPSASWRIGFEESPSLSGDSHTRESSPPVSRSRNDNASIHNSSLLIFNYFRGLYPWPGIWTLLRLPASEGHAPIEKRLKITDVELAENELIIKKVQLEGKQEINFDDFKQKYFL